MSAALPNIYKTIHIHIMTVLNVVVQRGKLEKGKELSYRSVCPNTATAIANVIPIIRDQNFFHIVVLRR